MKFFLQDFIARFSKKNDSSAKSSTQTGQSKQLLQESLQKTNNKQAAAQCILEVARLSSQSLSEAEGRNYISEEWQNLFEKIGDNFENSDTIKGPDFNKVDPYQTERL